MILVVADDLLFRSKISTVAKGLGVVVRAATTPEAATARLAEELPSLVLIDLDGQKPQPFEVLRLMAEHQRWQQLTTIGFVSHVHTDLVQRARALGITRVLARSAFVMELPQLLGPHAEIGRPGPSS